MFFYDEMQKDPRGTPEAFEQAAHCDCRGHPPQAAFRLLSSPSACPSTAILTLARASNTFISPRSKASVAALISAITNTARFAIRTKFLFSIAPSMVVHEPNLMVG